MHLSMFSYEGGGGKDGHHQGIFNLFQNVGKAVKSFNGDARPSPSQQKH